MLVPPPESQDDEIIGLWKKHNLHPERFMLRSVAGGSCMIGVMLADAGNYSEHGHEMDVQAAAEKLGLTPAIVLDIMEGFDWDVGRRGTPIVAEQRPWFTWAQRIARKVLEQEDVS